MPVSLAGQLLFVFFVLREEFAFLFQTFSRNDPPGKAPPSRGRSVLKKKGRTKEGNVFDLVLPRNVEKY